MRKVLHRRNPPPELDPTTRDATFEFERLLMDADRTMLQSLQTSLSLIGLGITLNTFFNNVVARRDQLAQGERMARDVGLGLLILGLFLLTAAIWNQGQYRRDLLRRFEEVVSPVTRGARLGGRATPSFVSSVALLAIGLGATMSIMLRRAF